METVKKKY